MRYKQVTIRRPQKQIVLRWFSKNAVSLLAPNNENPNLFSIGEGFGFFVFFGKQNAADALDVTMAQRPELDYLIYNDPLGYADLILNGDPEEYLKNVTGSHGLED